MVERARDKSSFCSRLINALEKLIWEATKLGLNIQDKFTVSQGLSYTWDNGQQDGQRILARLDRFYTFCENPSSPTSGIESYRIVGECGFSDHLPVTLTVKLGDCSEKRSRWVMNSKYMKETSAEVEKLWREVPRDASFFSKIRKVVRYYRIFCKTKANELRKSESELRRELALALTSLQEDQFSRELQLRVASLRERLSKFDKAKATGARIRSRVC